MCSTVFTIQVATEDHHLRVPSAGEWRIPCARSWCYWKKTWPSCPAWWSPSKSTTTPATPVSCLLALAVCLLCLFFRFSHLCLAVVAWWQWQLQVVWSPHGVRHRLPPARTLAAVAALRVLPSLPVSSYWSAIYCRRHHITDPCKARSPAWTKAGRAKMKKSDLSECWKSEWARKASIRAREWTAYMGCGWISCHQVACDGLKDNCLLLSRSEWDINAIKTYSWCICFTSQFRHAWHGSAVTVCWVPGCMCGNIPRGNHCE